MKKNINKIQETLFRVDFQVFNNTTLTMGYFVDKHETLRRYKYTNYNKYHSLRVKYHIMHTTYRVDKNKDLMENQSGTMAVGLTSQPGSVSAPSPDRDAR